MSSSESDSDIEESISRPVFAPKRSYIKPPKLNTHNRMTQPNTPTLKSQIQPSQLNLSNEMTQPNTSTFVFTFADAQRQICIVPEFSGEPYELSNFINKAEHYCAIHGDSVPSSKNVALLDLIVTRIKGKAARYISTKVINSWDGLKALLLEKYGDPRSEIILELELTRCSQQRNWSYSDYYDQIEEKLANLLDFVRLNDKNSLQIKTKIYEEKALMVFRAGVREPYRSHLRHIRTRTLKDAFEECRTFDNEVYMSRVLDYQTNHKEVKDSPKMLLSTPTHNKNSFARPLPNSYQQPSTSQPKFNHNPFTTSASFPKGPINIQSRPIKQHFPTNQQVFGKPPSNVFKKNVIPPHQLPKPTPMSTTSRNTFTHTATRPQQHYINFKSTGPPNFIAEELTNMEEPADPETEQEFEYEENFGNYDNEENYEGEEENFQHTASSDPTT